MNKLFIVGNLTRDPDLRVTQSGLDVCSFTVAVNRRRREGQPQEADFFRVTAWREMGKNCKQYLAKGRKVAVTGSVSVSAYKNSNGEAQASMNVFADEVEFLSPKKEQPAEQNTANAVEQRSKYVEVVDEELPWG